MTERYNVVSEGRIDAGHTIQQVQDNLCRIFKAPPDKIHKIFCSGGRAVVKRNVAYDEAVKYVAALKRAGALTSLERVPDEQESGSPEIGARHADNDPLQTESDDPVAAESAPNRSACPKCGYQANSDRDPLMTSGQCPSCGIVLAKYQALQAEMAEILRPEAQQLKKQILKVIKKGLPQAGLYVVPNIPREKLMNAKRACNFPKNDELLGLVDCTAFGSAKECLVFGVRGLYMKDVPGFSLKNGMIAYAELAGRSALTSDGMFINFGNSERLNCAGSSCPAGKILALLQAVRNVARTAVPAQASQQKTNLPIQASLPLKDRILEALRGVLPQDGFFVAPDIPQKNSPMRHRRVASPPRKRCSG